MEILKDIFYKYWQFIIIAILCILLFQKCENKKLTKYDTPTYTTVSSKKEALEVIPLKKKIAKKFSKIKSITQATQEVKIDSIIPIIFHDSIPCNFERTGEIKNKEYSFNYKIDNHSANILNFKITPDTLTIVDGSKRKWFLGKENNAVDISHSNKYFYNSDIQHVEVKKKKQFYETRLFNIGVGVLIGYKLK